MKSNQESSSRENQSNELKERTMKESLEAMGSKLVIKKGSIFMPLSKIQREHFKTKK